MTLPGTTARRFIALAALVLSTGCHSPKRDMERVCDAANARMFMPQSEEEARGLRTWTEANLRDPEAVHAMQSMDRVMDRGLRVQLLRRYATNAGLTTCPVADLMAASIPATPQP